jgi:EAL domain-containing protein (putative c-di-GMP-specific phosphodiesterase class I)
VYYQPIFSLATHYIVGFEALVRWQHPERGLLEPEAFLKMADETGIIVSIDRLVLRQACRQMREWMTQFPGNGLSFISTNLSNKQISQPDFVDYVSRVLKETGVSPQHLKLEITENVIIENPEETVAMLTRLKALGVHLYIDDFGTGYSSLSYLHQLPIDGLKIDRSFIKRMGEHGENQEIIKTIMLLARDMNINVISEGLEVEHQMAQIKALGCEYGQGYIFSKPVDSGSAGILFENPQGVHRE